MRLRAGVQTFVLIETKVESRQQLEKEMRLGLNHNATQMFQSR